VQAFFFGEKPMLNLGKAVRQQKALAHYQAVQEKWKPFPFDRQEELHVVVSPFVAQPHDYPQWVKDLGLELEKIAKPYELTALDRDCDLLGEVVSAW
jgi:hypothetical protein